MMILMLYAIKIKIHIERRIIFMKTKKIFAIMGICAALTATTIPTFAASEISNEQTISTDQTYTVQPRVKWTGDARLGTNYYYNVTSSNNIFSDSPTVTNYAGNPGSIRVRIIGGNGKQIGKTKDIKAGKSVIMDKIPANSGTYTLQAKALDKEGKYTISID